MPPPSPPGPTGRRAVALVLLLALALRALDLFDPWAGRGFKSAFATHTTGAFARNFVEHGLLESRGMAYSWRVELADGSVERAWYPHHPPLPFLLTALSMKAFGGSEWSARLPWLLASLLSLVSLHRLVAFALGARAALLALLFLAVVPFHAAFATMLWADGAILALYGLVAHRTLRWLRDGASRHLRAAGFLFFAGGLFDWSMHFLAPGLLAHGGLVARRERRRVGPLLWIPAGIALSLLVHWVHMQAVLPPGHSRVDLAATLRWTTSLPLPLPDFLAGQASAYLRHLTPPLAILIALETARSIVRGVRGRLDREAAFLLTLLLPGPVYIFLFPARAANHDFFLALSLPGFAIAAARACQDLASFLRARLHAPRAIAAIGLAALAGAPAFAVVAAWRRERSDAVATLVREEWLAPLLRDRRAVILATTGQGMSLPFYSAAPVVTGVDDVARLEDLRRRVLARLEPDRRAVFLFDLQGRIVAAPLHAALSALAAPERRLVRVDRPPIVAFDMFDLRRETPR